MGEARRHVVLEHGSEARVASVRHDRQRLAQGESHESAHEQMQQQQRMLEAQFHAQITQQRLLEE
eukprot:4454681-Amphidinium_carterae.1